MATPRERIVTPIGTARYAWLKDPDTKFNSSGVWRTQLILPVDQCTALTERLDELAEEAFNAACRKAGPLKKKYIVKHPPYILEIDEKGLETGNIVFKFKKNTTYLGKRGEIISAKLPAFDAKGKLILEVPPVYSGSSLRVNFSPLPYFVEAHKAAGVSLWMNSFQIINLISGAQDAASYGYQEEDGDYIYENAIAEVAKVQANTESKIRSELKALCEVVGIAEGKEASDVLSELIGGKACFDAIAFSEKANGISISPLTEAWEKAMHRVDNLKDAVESSPKEISQINAGANVDVPF